MTEENRTASVPAGLPPETAASSSRSSTPAGNAIAQSPARRRWPLFVALAVTIVVADQLAKAQVTRLLDPGESVDIVGDLVRIVFGQNSGALFGLFKDNAAMFGLVSLLVIGLIVAYHARSAASLYLTVTLGLLLGGAIGNMIDRLRLGYVVDFVDVGIGSLRFYTFNVADTAISLSILLLFVAALRPSLVDGDAAHGRAGRSGAASATAADAAAASDATGGADDADDDWDDGPSDAPPDVDAPPDADAPPDVDAPPDEDAPPR